MADEKKIEKENKCSMTLDEIMLWYNKLNTLFFFGELPSVSHIKIIFDDSINEAAAYVCINNRNGYESEKTHQYPDEFYYILAINPTVEWNKNELISGICHEMIHLWQWEEIDFKKYSEDYSWMNGHNKSFVSKMKTINLLAQEDEGLLLEGIKINVKIAG